MGEDRDHRTEQGGGHPLFPDHDQFWYETLRLIGASDYGGASFGEVLATARTIPSGDGDGWYAGWTDLAERVAAEAEADLATGHRVSARDGFLRAANYHRSAEFFLHGAPADPRIDRSYGRAVAAYRAAAALFEPPIEPVAIPYEGTTLPGYFHPAGLGGGRRPLLLMMPGFDGTAEELHFQGARAAVERGYHVLTFEGPGQAGPVHIQGLPFRPDWERVVGPVVDHALARADVDPDRVALSGSSFGGLLAPRAAAFEHRLAALICDDGLFDYAAPVLRDVPEPERDRYRARLRAAEDPALDAELAARMAANPTMRWAMEHGMYVMAAATPRAVVAKMLDYRLDGIAERIRCPTLVCDAEEDLFFKGQAELLFARLRCRKTLLRFTAAEGAGAHCEIGAARLAYGRILNWLDDVFAGRDVGRAAMPA